MAKQVGLTRTQVSRALRTFIGASGIWGIWGQAGGIGTAVFTGFALRLGADGSFIALFTSIAYFLALSQFLSPLLSRRIRNPKRFILKVGFLEILFRFLIVLIPFLFPAPLRLTALVALVGVGLLCGYTISPFYGTWVANTVPENIRARFISHQTIVSTILAMIAGFLIGQFLDLFPDERKIEAFVWVFTFGAACGWLGYGILGRAPYPADTAETDSHSGSHGLSALLQPLRDSGFRRAVLFYGMWTFAMGLSGPLYSVFMLDELGISYTRISVYNALFMLTSIGAYRVWAVLIDRFGSKAVLQILVPPAVFMPLIWALNQPGAAHLVPVAMIVGGVLYPGIGVAVTPLLYGLLPQGSRRTVYLASWSVAVNMLGALGPLTAAALVRLLQDVRVELPGLSLGHLQLIFLVGVCCRTIPVIILRKVQDGKGISSRYLLSQLLRGNLLSYAYNAVIYHMAAAEDRRARAAYRLGKSGNPLAVEQLIQALSDASPRVRSSAARALGETGSQQATESLLRELADGSSDIRSEAAEALGRLGHHHSIDPLLEALEDPDPRLRIAAIRGLASIDREEVRELLFWHFSATLDPLTVPTLVDALSKMGDQRIIKRALMHLEHFPSTAVRLQLLDSVCQALGAQGQFYRLLSCDESKRIMEISRLLKRAANRLCRTTNLDVNARSRLSRPCQRLVQAYEDDNTEWMLESVRQITGIVRDGLAAEGRPAYDVLSVFVVILAINSFLASSVRAEMPVAQEIFLAVCLNRLAGAVQKLDPPPSD